MLLAAVVMSTVKPSGHSTAPALFSGSFPFEAACVRRDAGGAGKEAAEGLLSEEVLHCRVVGCGRSQQVGLCATQSAGMLVARRSTPVDDCQSFTIDPLTAQ